LGREFLAEVEALLAHVGTNPLRHQKVHGDIRRAIPRRFPYGVFYRVERNDVVVLAIFICIAIPTPGRIEHRDPSTLDADWP
jgi:plasmid stabilization system protein ParE